MDILRAGDWVEIKSQDEVAETLDANGTIDGLPFMPEMVDLCGRTFRVLRRAEKTCVEVSVGDYEIREFCENDVFLLEGLRCSGSAHDGCQRLCMLLWKQAWLRRVDSLATTTVSPVSSSCASLSSKLKTKNGTTKDYCQSTALHQATTPGGLRKFDILRKCLRDVRHGGVRISSMIALIAVPAFRKVRDRLIGRPVLKGTLRKTPVGTLNLQPGERVTIKSLEEMRETLDRSGKNRGLVCDIELEKFCGTSDRVLGRLDRMISEPTGEMRKVEGTVILENNTCMCARVVGGCPRLEFCYWREVWLNRSEPSPAVEP